ncbi:MAG: flagellar hook-basal body complex protein [Alphaproteobacteria bacterium]|nr:flagellar hook-basal body complex protein [Alphaproteobacteria bacterium]MBL6945285.1 flagellar hook-basal body complex protein [Rhodospirillales bacterium]
MSLFGAMFSGVSGLTAQSSAMGAVSDNITNVSTVGYKNTDVNFQTLVTKQVSSTFYSAGGVQSRPRQRNEVQGLLQSSTSQTDMALSGQGFFVVNEAAQPTISDQYLYTRAGSYIMDNDGYLKNSSGFYLQAWPTDASGIVTATDPVANPLANQNIISTDFLETVNLNRVGGTASATSTIAVGANLPASADTYDANLGTTQDAYQKTDIQFFDTLGNANNVSVVYKKSARANQWDVEVAPPSGTAVITLYDSTPLAPLIYDSQGLLEFTERPADGSTVSIDGITYEFDSNAAVTGTNTQVDISTTSTLAQDVAALLAAVLATDSDFDTNNNRVTLSPNSTTALAFKEDGTGSIVVNPAGLLNTAGDPVTNQTTQYTVAKQNEAYTDATQFTFDADIGNNDTMIINGVTYTFLTAEAADSTGADTNVHRGVSLAATLADLEAAVEANDAQMSGTRVRLRENADSGANDTLVLESLPSGTYNVVFSTGFVPNVDSPDGVTSYAVAGQAAATTQAVNTAYGIQFDSDGLPAAFNVGEIQVESFASGAADMDDDAANASRITVDFGTLNEANGMTQFGAEFTPVFIQQNGSRFGTFAGVTVDTAGLVTALFDNGETRTIFKVPIATFVNTNALESRTGNSWNATQASGDFTLREADTGPAGQVVQGALEASTVDIGEEFTKMIVVQRAYSASTKIIRTADEMLEELTRVK